MMSRTPHVSTASSSSYSSATPPSKKRSNDDDEFTGEPSSKKASSLLSPCGSVCREAPCTAEAAEVRNWTVEDVCKFVAEVETCGQFVEVKN